MTPPRLDEGSEREAYPPLPEEFLYTDRPIWRAICEWSDLSPGPTAGLVANRIDEAIKEAMRAYVDADRASRAALSTGRLGGEATLKGRADALIQAGHAFWQACRVEAGGGAVRWLNATDGTTIIFTRGEYAQQLLARINEDYQGPVTVFEHTDPEDEERGVVAKAAPAAQSQGDKSHE